MSAFVLSKIFPSMNIDASQRFIFGLDESPEPLGSFKIDNIFVPTLGSPSLTNFEMRNEALSGYRWIHGTGSTETYGSFKLQKFLEASPTGIDILTFNDDGTFIIPGVTTIIVDDFNLNGNINNSYGNLGIGDYVLNSLVLYEPGNTYNLGVGAGALYSFTTGTSNTGIGQYALFGLETGTDNTGLGNAVGLLFENGDNNTFLGASAAPSFVSGSFNVFLGKGSAYNFPGGNRNTILGTDAFVGATATCDDNTVIGYNAASNQLQYNQCILIGKNADTTANNLTNAIAIGASVGTSDSMVLGNSSMKVGIRTSTPQYPLDVVGTGGISINVNSNRIIGVASPSAGTDAANKAYVDSQSVSIGDAKFIIQTADADLPNAQILGSLTTGLLKNTTSTGVLSTAVIGTDYYAPSGANNIVIQTATNGTSYFQSGDSTKYLRVGYDGSSLRSVIEMIGHPGLRFRKDGTILGGFLLGSTPSFTVGADPQSDAGILSVGGIQNITSEDSSIRATGSSTSTKIEINNSTVSTGRLYELRSNSDGTFGIYDRTSTASRLSFDTTGISTFTNNVLISTASAFDTPYYQVGHSTDVVQLGYDGANDYSFINIAGSSNDRLAFRVGGTGIAAFLSSGLFGFGTITPTQAKIVAVGGVANVASEDSSIRVTGTSNATKIELECTTGSGKLYELRSDNAGAFSIFDRTGTTSRLLINTSGNIGINTTSPTTGKLVISGGVANIASEDSSLRVTGTSNATKIEIERTTGSGKLFELRSNSTGNFDITDRTAAVTRFQILTGGDSIFSAKLGLGGTTPHAQLQLSSTVTNRQLVLYEAANNDFQFHGFGSVSGGFGYNINDVGDSHIFYAGVNSSSRNEVARISGVGTFTISKILGKTANAPSVAAGSAAGSSPTLTVAGSELSGTFQVVAGTTPSGTTIATFTLAAANANSSYGVGITPANLATAALATTAWINVTSTTQFTISCNTPLVATTTYKWNYHIIGC